MRSNLAIAAFVSFFLTACGISHSYSTSDISTIPSLEDHHMVVPGVLDARANGHRSEEPSVPGDDAVEELAEVRASVREHVGQAGLASARTPAAPERPEDAAAILTEAAAAGAEEVLFVRYHGADTGAGCASTGMSALLGVLPWVILESLPLSRRSAFAGFEVFVVNPQTGEVLASPARLAAAADRFSGWACGFGGGGSRSALMKEMMRDAMHSLLEEVARDRTAGYPNRFQVSDVATFIVNAPDVRQTGAFVRGLGWQHPLPEGWLFSAEAGPSGGAQSPAGTRLFTETEWCLGTTAHCASLKERSLRREGAELVDRYEVDHEGEAATEFELRTANGDRAYARVIGADGITLTLHCQAPSSAPEHDLGACQRAFEGAHLTPMQRADSNSQSR